MTNLLNSAQRNKSARNSSLEILRIISMILIILHHSVVHGGLLNEATGFNRFFAIFFVPGGKLAFNAFIALSTWFLVDAKFKSKRAITVIGEVIFYAITVYLVSCIFTKNFSVKDFFGNLLPISGNIHGFATAYISFYLLTPLLSKIVKGFTKAQSLWAMILAFFLQTVSHVISYFVGGWHDYSSTISLFIMFYFIVYYIKHFAPNKDKWYISLIVFVICWAIIVVKHYITNTKVVEILNVISADESSLLYIIGGYAMFALFKSLPAFTSKSVNYVAGSTLSILLIHDHNFFRSILWHNILSASSYSASAYLPLFMIISCAMIFVGCTLVDIFRREIIEKYTFKLCRLDKLCAKLDSIWLTPEPKPADSEFSDNALSNSANNGDINGSDKNTFDDKN